MSEDFNLRNVFNRYPGEFEKLQNHENMPTFSIKPFQQKSVFVLFVGIKEII